jgi:hypothetical protein
VASSFAMNYRDFISFEVNDEIVILYSLHASAGILPTQHNTASKLFRLDSGKLQGDADECCLLPVNEGFT